MKGRLRASAGRGMADFEKVHQLQPIPGPCTCRRLISSLLHSRYCLSASSSSANAHRSWPGGGGWRLALHLVDGLPLQAVLGLSDAWAQPGRAIRCPVVCRLTGSWQCVTMFYRWCWTVLAEASLLGSSGHAVQCSWPVWPDEGGAGSPVEANAVEQRQPHALQAGCGGR